MSERTPGRGRYAKLERERRWLLGARPDDVVDPVEILDTYIAASTLRLREARAGSTVTYKLGQKVREEPWRPSLARITNIYVTQGEFALLSRLGGATLAKSRWHWHVGARVFSVDVFRGHLSGLVLAELELEQGDEGPPVFPPLAVAEVTDDDRFSGGRLARFGPAEAQALLAESAARIEAATRD